jgi:transcriptional regulator with XRE-family HTH domain
MATPAMKEETKLLIAKFHAQGVSQRAIAARLGVSNGAVDKFKNYKGQEPKVETSLDDRSSVAHLQAKSRTLERTIKGLLEERGKHKALVEDLRGAVAAIVPYPRVPFRSKSTSSKPVAAVLKLSDWQIGEVIDSTETEGFGSFDFATAEDRVLNQLIPGFLSWVDMHRKAGYNLRRLDIFSEADLVSGNIPL